MEAAMHAETSSAAPGDQREVGRTGGAWTGDREDTDPARTLQRLEAALSGFAELCYRRRRQKLWVRQALTLRADAGPLDPVSSRETENRVNGSHEGIYPSMEEQFVEQNLVLLRKQLDSLRRQKGGGLSLQEVGHKMKDLRLDAEESHDPETDSRASSGFYELSEAVSGSLSNLSNSVFSETLSGCPSSDCGPAHYHPIGSSHCLLDGQPPLSGTFRRSFSTPHPPPAGPSSLQSPGGPADLGPAGPRSAGPLLCAERHARLDGYISALLRRRSPAPGPPPPRRPRTSVTADPTQTGLRPARLGARRPPHRKEEEQEQEGAAGTRIPPPSGSAPRTSEASAGLLAPPRKNHKPRPRRQTMAGDRTARGPSPPPSSTALQAGRRRVRTGSKSRRAGQEESRRRGADRTRSSGSGRFRLTEDPRPRRSKDRPLDTRSPVAPQGRRPPHPPHPGPVAPQGRRPPHPPHPGPGAPRGRRPPATAAPGSRSRSRSGPGSRCPRPADTSGCSRASPSMVPRYSSASLLLLLPPSASSTLRPNSQEERSSPTSNRFADQESCQDTSSGTRDGVRYRGGGGGGGAGGEGWVGRRRRAVGGTPDVVRIKASGTLKKKLLRFRGGSLKLITTV